MDSISGFLAAQSSRPLSVALAVLALFVPASLIIFVCQPALFFRLGVQGVLLVSTTISLPILLLCYGIFFWQTNAALDLERESKDIKDEFMVFNWKKESLVEWPSVLLGAQLANVVLYIIAAVAYFRLLRIGATMLLTSMILCGFWLLSWLIWWVICGHHATRERRAALDRLIKVIEERRARSHGASVPPNASPLE